MAVWVVSENLDKLVKDQSKLANYTSDQGIMRLHEVTNCTARDQSRDQP